MNRIISKNKRVLRIVRIDWFIRLFFIEDDHVRLLTPKEFILLEWCLMFMQDMSDEEALTWVRLNLKALDYLHQFVFSPELVARAQEQMIVYRDLLTLEEGYNWGVAAETEWIFRCGKEFKDAYQVKSIIA